MTRDDNKRLTSITYNTLNLPETIVKATDTETRTISYAYDATGAKHENRLPNGDKLQYLGKFVYRNGSLEYILNEEGKLNVAGSSGSYQFFVKDHLGNTRLSINADTKEVAEINHYYPFGMRMAGGTEDPNQKYLYNGKELQDETDWLDYGARMYMADIGRWSAMDAFAEKYIDFTPYQYAANNPLIYLDVNGDSLQVVIMKGLTSSDPVLKDRTYYLDSKIADNVKKFVGEARAKYSALSVNNTFRDFPSSQIKTKNTTSKGLSRHQGGFAIDLNGVKILSKDELKDLNSIASKYGLYPIKNQSKVLPHFSTDPVNNGYKDLASAVSENSLHYKELTSGDSGVKTSAVVNKNNKVVGVKYENTGTNNAEWKLLMFRLLYKDKK